MLLKDGEDVDQRDKVIYLFFPYLLCNLILKHCESNYELLHFTPKYFSAAEKDFRALLVVTGNQTT